MASIDKERKREREREREVLTAAMRARGFYVVERQKIFFFPASDGLAT